MMRGPRDLDTLLGLFRDAVLALQRERETQGPPHLRTTPVGRDTICRTLGLSRSEGILLADWLREVAEEARTAEQVASAQQAAGTETVHEVEDADPDPGYSVTVDASGVHVFVMPRRARPLRLPRDVVEQMLADYSNWSGEGVSMGHVARTYGLTRREFHGVKRAMGWTKDSLPLLEDDPAEMTEDEIATFLQARKVRAAEVRAQDGAWASIRRDADRWREYEAGTLEPVREALAEVVTTYQAPAVRFAVTPRHDRRWCLVINPTDLHVGKRQDIEDEGVATVLETARERLTMALGEVLACVPSTPEVIYLCIGGDWFNVDNWLGTTTRGTPQQSTGSLRSVWAEGCRAALDAVGLCLDVAPVEVIHVPGNHDRALGGCMADLVAAHFRNEPRVTVREDRGSYVALQYGANMHLFHHGDGIGAATGLAGMMASEWPAMWGQTRHRYAHGGHVHHTQARRIRSTRRVQVKEREFREVHEDRGVMAFTYPSLSAGDWYHRHKGYVGTQPALMATCFDFDAGLFAMLRSAVQAEGVAA